MSQLPVIIIGSGAAGLSTAGALKHRGIDALLLDKDTTIGGTWERRYDRLHLHTIRSLSSLAHYPIPDHLPQYLPKDAFAAYLRSYARHFNLRIVGGCAVHHVRRSGAHRSPTWVIESGCGTWQCRVVVIATGQYHVPILPSWAGLETYRGTLLHSVDYRHGRAFTGKRVLVIGVGNSGAEIATDLSTYDAEVAISIRTPPPIVARDPLGLPVQRGSLLLSQLPPGLADRIGKATAQLFVGDLTQYGLPPAAWWPYSAQRVPVIDVGFVDAVRHGRIQVRPAVVAVDPMGVVYSDGRREAFDAIVAATGFTTGLETLLPLPDLLNEHSEPRFPSGQPTPYPGFYFMGFTHSLRGHLFEINRDSRRLATMIERYLREGTLCSTSLPSAAS